MTKIQKRVQMALASVGILVGLGSMAYPQLVETNVAIYRGCFRVEPDAIRCGRTVFGEYQIFYDTKGWSASTFQCAVRYRADKADLLAFCNQDERQDITEVEKVRILRESMVKAKKRDEEQAAGKAR